jgi:hypothetical protein
MGIILSIFVIMLALCFAAEAKDLPLCKRTYQILPPGVRLQ